MKNFNQKNIYLRVKDYSVSGESFDLCLNEEMDFLETVPQPSLKRLPNYYKSEDYISHTDAKRNILEFLYHFVREIALKRKLKLINNVNSGTGALLDVGCGTGDFLQVASRGGWKICGIEPNASARALANSKTNNSVYDNEKLTSLRGATFDVITLWHVLEHLPDPGHHFEIFQKLLKANGTLIIAVPNYKSFDAQLYKQFWAAYDVPRHLWHFNQNSIKALATKYNLEVVEVKPMKFDAYYVSLLSEKYKTGNLNYLRGFLNGRRSNQRAKQTGEYSSLIYVLKSGDN